MAEILTSREMAQVYQTALDLLEGITDSCSLFKINKPQTYVLFPFFCVVF